MSAQGNKNGHFIGGIVLGALMGAVAGILFAPTAGKDTRNKLKKMVDSNGEIIKNTKEKTEVAFTKTMDAIKHGFDKLGRIVDEKRHPHAMKKDDDDSDNSEAAA